MRTCMCSHLESDHDVPLDGACRLCSCPHFCSEEDDRTPPADDEGKHYILD